MNIKVVVLLAAVIVLAAVVRGNKDAKADHIKIMCRNTEIKIPNDIKTATHDCHKELVERKKAEKKTDHVPDACYVACKLEKLKVVHDGKVDVKAIDDSIEKTFPKDVHVEMKAAFKNCSTPITTKLDRKVDCAPYVKLAQCNFLALKKVCKNEKLMEP